MKKTIEKLAGDTEGASYELTVFRFKGTSKTAPTAYIQAALHAGELPGVVAVHSLMPLLRKAEAEGRILGDITIVPAANPVGRAQFFFGEVEGRFHLGTRTNFNRDFPLINRPDKNALPPANPAATADVRLKRLLVELSMGHDIVLDLHCDFESVPYLYVPAQLWPAMQDCAGAMGVDAVILWDGPSGAAFEEAAIHPYLQMPPEKAAFDRRVVTTVEYRGLADVYEKYAKSDAEGLYRVLATRGVIADEKAAKPRKFNGIAAPIDHVEMVDMPRSGAILFHVEPGQHVRKGAKLATIVHTPGEPDGSIDVLAPQAGYVFTRVVGRSGRAGDNLIKLIGEKRSSDARSGALEA
ncbi:MAG: succinylglutamate desuccinylase/aspartoacylase family protein [Mesorhizobium sp.]|nr:succinylglutamate desuccinylase/aspartoacylase family protein [Mesorhizobium sp.]MBL8576988.1 succinylglutamate desuccinylase/aspartoacylase family protein [Mesorhizobium sp.]